MNNIGIIERSSDRITVVDLASKQLQSNLVMITGEINQYSVSEWQSEIIYLMTTMTPSESKTKPIQLYINSYGGSVYDGLGLYDTIRHAIKKGYVVKTVNIGCCASMAAILLMAGSEGYRMAFPNSSVMIHEISYGDFGKLSEMKDSLEESKRLQAILNNIIKTCSKFNPDDTLRKDTWMDSETAISFGIIDKIL